MWLQSDRDAVEAWLQWIDGLCSCGHPRDVAWTRAADHQWDGDIRKCRVCAAMDKAEADHLAQADDETVVDVQGIKPIAVPRDQQANGQRSSGS